MLSQLLSAKSKKSLSARARRATQARRRGVSRRTLLEPLERRQLLSADPLTPVATLPAFESWDGELRDMAFDQTGNMYVVAEFYDYAVLETSTGDVQLNAADSSDQDAIVAKFDGAGSLLWYTQIGGSGNDYGTAIALDDAGNAYVTGYFTGNATFGGETLQAEGYSDFYASKLDANGSIQWTITNSDTPLASNGEFSDIELGADIAVDNAANLVNVVGWDRYGFVFQLDPATGNTQASRSFGGGKWDGSSIRALELDSEGNLYLTGDFHGQMAIGDLQLESGKAKGGDDNRDVFIARLTPELDATWARSVLGEDSVNDVRGPWDYALGIALGTEGPSESVYITGHFLSSTLDFGDGVIVSHTSGSTGSDAFLASYDPDGNVQWAKNFNAHAYDVAANDNGNVLVVGKFADTVDFDPNPGAATTLTSAGPQDGYAAQFDASGGFVGAWQMGGTFENGYDQAVEVEFDSLGNAQVSGRVLTPADFPTGTIVADNPNNVDGVDSVAFVMTLSGDEPPTANDDTATLDEDTSVTGNVLANDTDPEGTTLSASLASGPANGSASLNTDGSFTYTPDTDFNGDDSFTYTANDGTSDSNVATVSLTINPVNDAPMADGDSYTAEQNTTLNVPAPGVLGNDGDVDGDTLTAAVLDTSGLSGSLTLGSDGSFSYTPVATGLESFTYTVSDGDGGSDTGTVAIAVTQPPTANDLSAATDEDAPVDVTLSGSDAETVELTFEIVTSPANGTLSAVTNQTGVAGTPNTDTALVTYTPNADFNGADSFTYRVTDAAGATDEATVSLSVNSVNDAPVADAGGPYSGTEGQAIAFDASGSGDVDGDTLTYVWHFGDGNSATGPQPSHAYAAAGSYTVSVAVSDGTTSSVASTTATVETETAMHVADLEGGVLNQGKHWQAQVSILVTDQAGIPIPGATVSGTWSGDSSGSGSAMTDSDGVAVVTSENIRKNQDSTTWTVGNIAHSSLSYDSSANTDPDGDSTGTSITVLKDGTTQPGPTLLAETNGDGAPAPLTLAAAEAMVDAARAQWSDALGRPVTQHVAVAVADLPGTLLGRTDGNLITLDSDAVGLGWFLDTTPGDHAEFGTVIDSATLLADGGPAHGKYDLLTTAGHEMGHVLGLMHSGDGVMAETLPPSTRRLAEVDRLSARATDVVLSQTSRDDDDVADSLGSPPTGAVDEALLDMLMN